MDATTAATSNNGGTFSSNSSPLLMGWIGGSVVCVALPLTMFVVSSLIYREEDSGDEGNYQGERNWWQRNGQGEEENSSWFWSEERRPEDQGRGAVIFVYIWSLLLFAALSCYGHGILKNSRAERGTLFGALVLFTNLAFIGAILVGALAIQRDGPEMEEGHFFAQFPSCVCLTFCYWTLFSAVYCALLYRGRPHVESTFPEPEEDKEQDGPITPFTYCEPEDTSEDTRKSWGGTTLTAKDISHSDHEAAEVPEATDEPVPEATAIIVGSAAADAWTGKPPPLAPNTKARKKEKENVKLNNTARVKKDKTSSKWFGSSNDEQSVSSFKSWFGTPKADASVTGTEFLAFSDEPTVAKNGKLEP